MGPVSCNWVKILYSLIAFDTNLASQRYEDVVTVFDIAIEPLAIAIRSERIIRGITGGETSHKICWRAYFTS